MSDNIEDKAKEILFEALRNATNLSTGDHLLSQSKMLEQVAGWFDQVASIEGGIGYSAFHHAMLVSDALEEASRTLVELQQLCSILYRFQKVSK